MFDLPFHAPETPPPTAKPWGAADTTRLYREHLATERRLGLLPPRRVKATAKAPKKIAGHHRASRPLPVLELPTRSIITRDDVLAVAARLYKPGDVAYPCEIAGVMGVPRHVAIGHVCRLRKDGLWLYESPGKGRNPRRRKA